MNIPRNQQMLELQDNINQKQLEDLVHTVQSLSCPNLADQIDYQSLIQQNFLTFSDLIQENYFLQQQSNEKTIQLAELHKQAQTSQNQKMYYMANKEDMQKIRTKLSELNNKIETTRQRISGKQFYREYELMRKEIQGLKKQNINLQEILKTVEQTSKRNQ